MILLPLLFGGGCALTGPGEGSGPPSEAGTAPLPRHDYGALGEPAGQVLHGAGQSADAFIAYEEALGPKRAPAMFMVYFGLRGYDVGNLQRKAAAHGIEPGARAPQIGLSMTADGQPEKVYADRVAAGAFDGQLRAFAEDLKAWPGISYLRIGYECNGHWNGYPPDDYIAAWHHVAAMLTEVGVRDRVALVWCVSADGPMEPAALEAWYPGDAAVDWWSVDLFAAEDLDSPLVAQFFANAHAAEKPVLIGESTPRRIGVHEGAASWEAWYQPYFDLIHREPGLKGFSYINWDWARYPQWSDWGDGRIQENPTVLERYRAEMSRPLYRHAD